MQSNSHPLAGANELCTLGCRELTALYSTGEVSPVDVAKATLARAEEVNPQFNAFTLIDHEGALRQAHASEQRWRKGSPNSLLDGVPTTLKDIVWVKGMTIRYGSLTTNMMPSVEDAPSVQRLRESGAVFLGLTTTPELGWKAVTDSPLSGITRNPWAPETTAGGSSGGAAVAAATGAGVFHLGTDGGGSIRIPASFTGIVGLKPTYGRVAAFPASAFGTVAHIGPMGRSVDDVALMLMTMAGRDNRDWMQGNGDQGTISLVEGVLNGARIGYWSKPPCGYVEPEVVAVVEMAVENLRLAGAHVEAIDLPGSDLLELFHHHWFTGAANRVGAISAALQEKIDPGLLEIARIGAAITAPALMAAQIRRAEFGAAMDRLMAKYDFLVSPGTAVAAFTAGEEVPPKSGLSRWTEWAGFSFPINLSQQPACVVPCGRTKDGRPIGLQFIGARGDDSGVLSVARDYELFFPDFRASNRSFNAKEVNQHAKT
jgi:aspartyl-tRNA(Asn)/glutamyl-tRNA(Gln) amidotransferase subunit A